MRTGILTITLNPAIDHTLWMKSALVPGELHYVEKERRDPGGKGINLARAIRKLGGQSRCSGFIAGEGAHLIEQTLVTDGIPTSFVRASGELRTNFKLVEPGGKLTELNGVGFKASETEQSSLRDQVSRMSAECTTIAICGTVCGGLIPGFVSDLVRLARAGGARVAVDMAGDYLAEALSAGAHWIKPNLMELEQWMGRPIVSREDMIAVGKGLPEGTGMLLSLGAEGALVVRGEEVWVAAAPEVVVSSPVGAGDAMLATWLLSLDTGDELPDALRWAVAAGSASVQLPGTQFPTREQCMAMMPQVEIWGEY